ncbi:PREDICTED: endogenous retrovirus group K member 18 Pol protein-like [Nicotiana attenuata]|uniref:endogenous retrovirus group K member 18 Pol protein-like n=1 Tax=Nicotiana attenuata TaxID=49451 RepID=UPI000905BE26|nr:PREDICTED: endogenous retrovirus group K member 18 Pol protein-like [Nicotiana attenuata]
MEADTLANLGSSTEMKGFDYSIFIQLLHSVLDVDGYSEVNSTNLFWDWRNEFIEYLRHGKLLKYPKASRAVRTEAARYCLMDGQLYRRSYQVPLARCLGASEVEAGPYPKISEREVVDFLWDRIICRFGIPKEIACDNGPQFIGSKVTKFLEDLKIKRITSSPYHLCANGQVESTNKTIIQHLKKRLEAAKGKWLDELPEVQWAYRKKEKSSTGETPFSLVYDAEALIPVEVGETTLRFSRENKEANNKVLLMKMDLLDERRDLAYVRMVAQKQRMERYYDRMANLRYFKVRDLALRNVTQSTREINVGKEGPK